MLSNIQIIIICAVFAAVWLATTITFVVMYKKKPTLGGTDDMSLKPEIQPDFHAKYYQQSNSASKARV